jgi:transaldolase
MVGQGVKVATWREMTRLTRRRISQTTARRRWVIGAWTIRIFWRPFKMPEGYFARIMASTPTRLWINNPTGSEIERGLARGAVGCTTNPSYAANLLRREPAFAQAVIESVALAASQLEDAAIGDQVQERMVQRVAGQFIDLYERSGGKSGLVSIQSSPAIDHDASAIIARGLAARAISPNVAVKVPATVPGLAALKELVAEDAPCIVTEVFSVSQLVAANETYLSASGQNQNRPAFFISPITGIFGDHLRKVAQREGIPVDPEVMRFAGVALGRQCYAVGVRRGYPGTLLFGGARGVDDFLGLVGGATAATINYSTVDEILALDPPVASTIELPMPAGVVEELVANFPEFRRSLEETGLIPEEFELFGPVQHFRETFAAAWDALLGAVRAARPLPLHRVK